MEENSPSVEYLHANLRVGSIIVKHKHIANTLATCLGMCAIRGTKELKN
jgi:hypothetical protein